MDTSRILHSAIPDIAAVYGGVRGRTLSSRHLDWAPQMVALFEEFCDIYRFKTGRRHTKQKIMKNNNRNEALLQKLIEDVRRRMAAELPDEGDFQTIEEEIENTDDSVNLTHFALRVIKLPKWMENSDVERYMEMAAYKLPCPYMSTRSVMFGSKPELLAKLDEGQLVQQLLGMIPKLADDLRDF